MTDKLDIPALLPCPFCGGPADIHSDGDTFYARCQACGIGYQRVSKAAAARAWNTRSITTAIEIGRAIGMAQAAEMHDKWAAGCDEGLAHCIEVFHTPGQWYEQKSCHQDSAKYIREAAGAVDLEGLTERIARAIGNNVHDSGFDMAGEVNQRIYRSDARAVMVEIGLHAREN